MTSRVLHHLTSALGGSGSAVARDADGWATASLIESIRRVVYIAAVAWQAVMALVTFTTLGVPGLPLVLAQLALGGWALAGRRRAAPSYLLSGAMSLLGLLGYLASGDLGSTLVFAACWQINFASCIAGLLVLRMYVVPLVVGQAVVTTTTLLLTQPDWGQRFPLSIVVTQTAIILGLRLGLPALLRLSTAVDADAETAEREERAMQLTREASRRIAEESRVLHDTAINTLGAIANGSAHAVRGARVREQCARDVIQLQRLRSRQRPDDDRAARLGEIFEVPGLPIVRSGLGDHRLRRLDAELPRSVRLGVIGCVREAMTNAAKHSGADNVEIDLREADDALIVSVKDHGAGFDGTAPEGRGVATSILGRARDHGCTARVTSAPGQGTEVRLEVPLRAADDAAHAPGTAGEAAAGDSAALPSSLFRRAGLLWALGATAVSVVLTAAGAPNHFAALWPMIGVMCLSGLLFWRFGPVDLSGHADRGAVGRAPGARSVRALRLLLILCADLVFFLSAAATGFGSSDAVHWQALAATVPFVLLLATRPERRVVLIGAASWLVLAVALAAAAWSGWNGTEQNGAQAAGSGAAAQTLLVAGLIGLGFSAIWAMFQRLAVTSSAAAARDRRRAFTARLEAELAVAAQSSYRRWLDAGLDEAIGILRDIAEGVQRPDDPKTRSACADEEQYLRQLVQISPELVHLGRGLIASLRNARTRNVRFALRVGGADAPDETVASSIASTLQRGVLGTPAGESLNATLFPVSTGLQLTLTGASLPDPEPSSPPARRERFGEVQVLEITYAAAPAPNGTARSTERSEERHGTGTPVTRLPRGHRRGPRAAARAHRGAARA